jgi:hypothetical protein
MRLVRCIARTSPAHVGLCKSRNRIDLPRLDGLGFERATATFITERKVLRQIAVG